MEFNFVIDQKYTGWKRFHYTVKANSEGEALNRMKEEFQRMELNDDIFAHEVENLDDAEAYMTPDENGGDSTRELYNHTNGIGESDPIFVNGSYYKTDFDKEHYLEVEY